MMARGVVAAHLKAGLLAVIIGSVWSQGADAATITPPLNAAADLRWIPATGVLQLRYHAGVILAAKVQVRDGAGARAAAGEVVLVPEVVGPAKVEQRLRFALARPTPGAELVLRGAVTASPEAFPAETLGGAQTRFPMIRNSVGLSRNLRNNAVYDRRWDWVLTGPADGATRIEPASQSAGANVFAWESRGAVIELVFRPRFYQRHKNLRYFEPWTYKIRKDSITGWCSWWAYRGAFSQKDVADIASVMAEKRLRDFGYRWIQADDSYQRGSGTPESWLVWNSQFPNGIDDFVRTVRAAGFDPGIWMQVYFKDQQTVDAHPEWFVRNDLGRPFKAPWVAYGIDATSDQAAAALVRPVFRSYRRKDFSYVKIDTLRHLLYDSLHNAPHYGRDRGLTGDAVFRRYLSVAREELGPETFVLACWGVLPEAVGLADGCRLGGDGFGPATLQQYNSWNGVVWRNDPDHCDVRPLAQSAEVGNVTRTSAVQSTPADAVIRPSLVSLAGGMLMLSDKAEVYRDDANLEGLKRASPILFSVPGQLYDFDPVKSDSVVALDRTDVKAGTRPSPIDGDQVGEVCEWWMVEIDRPFEHWSVLARMNWTQATLKERTVRLADLGLPSDRDYLVYEFWSKRYLGAARGHFQSPALAPKGIHLYAIRQKLDRPQIVSTSRHISQGGADLTQVSWRARTRMLSGRSRVVLGDDYELAIRLPRSTALASATIDGRPATAIVEADLLRVSHRPAATGEVDWALVFRDSGP